MTLNGLENTPNAARNGGTRRQERTEIPSCFAENERLLDGDLGAGLLELGLGLLGFLLGNALEDDGGSALNELLGVSQTQTSLDGTHSLNNVDLAGTSVGQLNVEVGLLLSSLSGSSASSGGSNRSRPTSTLS